MRFKEKRLEDLFDKSSSYYKVPEYQRAYEWNTNEKRKRNQVREFWEDLNEFIESNSDFPMGNIIILKRGDEHEVVDGQQRLTTSLILIKSIIDKLEELGYKERASELKKRYIILILAFILLLGFFFRFYKLSSIPPGLYPDEAINGNDAWHALQNKNFQFFYPENNGREGLFINLISLSFALLKPSIFSLKIILFNGNCYYITIN